MKLKKHKIIYVDVDGTICENLEDMKEKQPDATYADAKPFHNRIKIINELFDEGHEIHYWTARGTVSGTDYTELTTQQLKDSDQTHACTETISKTVQKYYILKGWETAYLS